MTGRGLDLSNDLWRFSCVVYAAPGVAEACLYLQDRYGADVNLLLLGAWLGSTRGVRLKAPVLDTIPGASWQDTVIRPLRAARRSVKAGGLDDPSLTAFHAQLLAAELAAERIRQAELFRWAEHYVVSQPAVAGLARANLALLTGSPPEAAAALDRLADAAEAHRTGS